RRRLGERVVRPIRSRSRRIRRDALIRFDWLLLEAVRLERSRFEIVRLELRLVSVLAAPEIARLGPSHDGNVGDRLWPKLDDPRLDLRIDAAQQRTDIEIEHRAIAVDDPAGLGPRRQRVERALLERLNHLDPCGKS